MPITVCPNCGSAMSEISRRGIFIDVCPNCRGVWLDGGELEKLLATADAGAASAPSEPRYKWRETYRDAHRDDAYYREERGRDHRQDDDRDRDRDRRRDDDRERRRDEERDRERARDRDRDRYDDRPRERRRKRDGGIFELFEDLFD